MTDRRSSCRACCFAVATVSECLEGYVINVSPKIVDEGSGEGHQLGIGEEEAICTGTHLIHDVARGWLLLSPKNITENGRGVVQGEGVVGST